MYPQNDTLRLLIGYFYLVYFLYFSFSSTGLSVQRSMESFHTIMWCICLYKVSVIHFGDASILAANNWTVSFSAPVHGLINAAVQVRWFTIYTIDIWPWSYKLQSYYAYRIHIISGKYTISIISWTTSALAFVGTITIAVFSMVGPSAVSENVFRASTATVAVDVFNNVLNTATLCFFLNDRRSGVKRYTTYSSPEHIGTKLVGVWYIIEQII